MLEVSTDIWLEVDRHGIPRKTFQSLVDALDRQCLLSDLTGFNEEGVAHGGMMDMAREVFFCVRGLDGDLTDPDAIDNGPGSAKKLADTFCAATLGAVRGAISANTGSSLREELRELADVEAYAKKWLFEAVSFLIADAKQDVRDEMEEKYEVD